MTKILLLLLTFGTLILIQITETTGSECKDLILRTFCQNYGGCFQSSKRNHFGDYFFRNYCQSCGFCKGMDDEICKVLDLDDCKAQSIQEECPQMCSRSTDEAFCKDLNLDYCEEPIIKKGCPQMCSTAISANSTRAKLTSECIDKRKGHYCSDNIQHCHLDDRYIYMKEYCTKTCGFCEDNGGEFPFKNAYPGKFWPSEQCPPMHFEGLYTPISLEVASLEQCFQECRKHLECTAVGYQKKNPSICNLIKCPDPPPKPSGSNRTWDYYYLGSAFCGDPDCWPSTTAVGQGRPFCASDNFEVPFKCQYGELGCKCDQGTCCSPINQNYENCGRIHDPCKRAGKRSNSAVAAARSKEECSKIFPKGSHFMYSATPYYHSETKWCGCCIDKSESKLLDDFECGINPLKHSTRIINGHKVNDKNKYPWMVQLYKDEYKTRAFFCGGSLINFKYVLTAAHCFYDRKDPCKRTKLNKVFAAIGGNQLERPQAIRVPKENIIILKGYDCKRLIKDAALLKLPKSVLDDYLINGNMVPICLANDDEYTFASFNATVIGYGARYVSHHKLSEFLQEAVIPVLSPEDCHKFYRSVPPEKLCGYSGKTVQHGGTDHCFGDSGGPLMVDGTWFATDQLQQIGIVSASWCGSKPNSPAIYTRVTKIIKEITNIAGHIYTIFSVYK